MPSYHHRIRTELIPLLNTIASFQCDSILDAAQKEDRLLVVSLYLRYQKTYKGYPEICDILEKVSSITLGIDL